MTSRFDHPELLASVTALAKDAGGKALTFFRPGAQTSAGVNSKEGGSPVTEADLMVDRYLAEHLPRLVEGSGWLSEETADSRDRLAREFVFVVDPIDGTRAFVGGDPRWAVSIALVRDGVPVLAVLHLPALAQTFTALRGLPAERDGMAIRASQRPALAGARVSGPKSILEGLEKSGLALVSEPRVPSLAYRIAMVADGTLDASFASTNAWDWDIAAADLILRESGGRLRDIEGREPAYNGEHPRHGLLTAAPDHLSEELGAAVRRARDAARENR